MRLPLFACALLALAGCAQTSPSYIARTDKQSEVRLRDEYNDDIAGPDFAVLAGKVDLTETFRHDQPACQGIAADAYPTPAESAALRRWTELRMGYFLGSEALQIRAAAVSEKATPTVHRYVSLLDDGLKRSTALISDLADGKMTYCQFAEADKALTESVIAEAGPLHAELDRLIAPQNGLPSMGMGSVGPGATSNGMRDTAPIQNGMGINSGRTH